MTFFFNIDNLERESCNNYSTFIELLDIAYYKKLPSKRRKIRRIKLNLAGSSFILNLPPLLKAAKTLEPAFVVQYVKLCAKRDYMLYKLYGTKSLQLSYYPDIDFEAIKLNPLLSITKTEIHFKYE